MKKLISLTLIVFFSILKATAAYATVILESKKDFPQVITFTAEPEIKLPKEAFKALQLWNKNFKAFSLTSYTPSIRKMFAARKKDEVPMAFIADLNGDKIKEIALLGQDKKKQYAIVLHKKDRQWEVKVMTDWEYPEIEKSDVPGDDIAEIGVPFYILPSQSEEKGLQVETYMGPVTVYPL